MEPFNGAVPPEKQCREMSAIGVAQAPRPVVVLGKEERGVAAVVRVLVKQPIHRAQQALRLVECDGALAAKVRLQIGHQKSGGNPLSRNIGDDQAEPPPAKIEKNLVG